MADAAEPSFWAGARKFAVAIGMAVAGTSAAILAAVDDDHVTAKEWVAIGVGVLTLLVGPGLVYGVRNATKPAPPVEAAAPVVRAHVDGTVDLAWPDGDSDRAVVSRHLLEAMVVQHNKLTLALGQTAAPKVPRQWTPPT